MSIFSIANEYSYIGAMKKMHEGEEGKNRAPLSALDTLETIIREIVPYGFYQTASGIVIYKDEFIVIPYCDKLVNIEEQKKSFDEWEKDSYLIPLTLAEYPNTGGTSFRRSDCVFNERIGKEELLKHKFWFALAEGNTERLKRISAGFAHNKGFQVRLNDHYTCERPLLHSISVYCSEEECALEVSGNFIGHDNLYEKKFIARKTTS